MCVCMLRAEIWGVRIHACVCMCVYAETWGVRVCVCVCASVLVCSCLCVHMCSCVCVCLMWRSEDSLKGSLLPFYPAGFSGLESGFLTW